MKVIDKTNIITESVSQALEKIAFFEAVPPMEDIPDPQDILVAETDFAGSISGKIQIAAAREFIKEFAENMSGIEDLTDQQHEDALKELANITCGLVLPMLAESQKEEFDMKVPCLTDLSPPKWQDYVAEKDSVLLEVEGHPLCVRLQLKQ